MPYLNKVWSLKGKTMKIILNSKYEHLREYLKNLEHHFVHDGKEIFRDRNVVKTLEVDGLKLCVKKYASPSLPGKIAQRLYKTPKGKKAYYRPLQLRERGFESPEPVAFVKYHKGLVGATTYFVCLYSNYRYNMVDALSIPASERDDLIVAFARFVARLHERGFLHRDFSSSNVLYDVVNEKFRFALIDTNSIRTGRPVSVERGCENLAQLAGDDEFFTKLAKEYAGARNADPLKCLEIIQREWKKE